MTLAATSLSLIAALISCYQSYFEHYTSVRPSKILSIYYFFGVLFDIPRARTVWAIDGLHTVAIVFIVSMLIKAAIWGLELLEKPNLIIYHYKDGSPETWAGVFNRSLFGWLNPLLLSGNKTVFTPKDLYAVEKAMVPDPDIKHKLAILWEECKL